MFAFACLGISHIAAGVSADTLLRIFHDAPVRIIAAAAAVSLAVQFLKMRFPKIGGKWAILLNVVASCAALLAAADPNHFWSANTLAQLVTIIGTAAGFHSTAKALSKPAEPEPESGGGQIGRPGVVINTLLLLLTFGVACSITGCRRNVQVAGSSAPTDPYQKAAVIMNDVATDVQSAQNIMINLHKGTALSDAEYHAIQNVFGQVGTYGQQVDALIAAGASPSTIDDKVNAALTVLTSVAEHEEGVDPQTGAQITTLVQQLSQLLQSVITTFNPQHTFNQEYRLGPAHNRSTGRAAFAAWISDLPTGSAEQRRQRAATAAAYLGDSCRLGQEVSGGCYGIAVVAL